MLAHGEMVVVERVCTDWSSTHHKDVDVFHRRFRAFHIFLGLEVFSPGAWRASPSSNTAMVWVTSFIGAMSQVANR